MQAAQKQRPSMNKETTCQGNLPWAPWPAGYGPRLLDTVGSL
jgi:hypothetical protein